MTVVLATVGFTPEKITESLRHEADVSEVILFAGSKPAIRSDATVKRIRAVSKTLGIRCRTDVRSDPYDLVGCAIAYSAALAQLKEEAVFNISGGTGVMQSAATLAAFLHGVPLAYYNVDEKRYVRMPVVRWTLPRLSKAQTKILQALEAEPLPTSIWAQQTGLQPNLLAYHSGQLAVKGLVERDVSSGSPLWRVTLMGRMAIIGPPHL